MSKRKNAPVKQFVPPVPPTVRSFETYREVGDWEVERLREEEPYCWNRKVSIRRYRVTIELIDEPDEVLGQRALKLFREGDNYHHFEPLMSACRRYGQNPDHLEFGMDAPKKGKR